MSAYAPMLAGFRQGLRDLGWVEGHNMAIEYRSIRRGSVDRFPDLATEVVGLNVDLILAASIPGILAARRATSKIPIVMMTLGGEDIAAGGVIASLPRPGGNLTGVIEISRPKSLLPAMYGLRERVDEGGLPLSSRPVRTRDQPQSREDPRPHAPTVAAAAG